LSQDNTLSSIVALIEQLRQFDPVVEFIVIRISALVMIDLSLIVKINIEIY